MNSGAHLLAALPVILLVAAGRAAARAPHQPAATGEVAAGLRGGHLASAAATGPLLARSPVEAKEAVS